MSEAKTTKFICAVCGKPSVFQKGFTTKQYEVFLTIPCECKGIEPPPQKDPNASNVVFMKDYGFKPFRTTWPTVTLN